MILNYSVPKKGIMIEMELPIIWTVMMTMMELPMTTTKINMDEKNKTKRIVGNRKFSLSRVSLRV